MYSVPPHARPRRSKHGCRHSTPCSHPVPQLFREELFVTRPRQFPPLRPPLSGGRAVHRTSWQWSLPLAAPCSRPGCRRCGRAAWGQSRRQGRRGLTVLSGTTVTWALYAHILVTRTAWVDPFSRPRHLRLTMEVGRAVEKRGGGWARQGTMTAATVEPRKNKPNTLTRDLHRPPPPHTHTPGSPCLGSRTLTGPDQRVPVPVVRAIGAITA